MAVFEIMNNLFLTLEMGDVYIDGNNKYPILVIDNVDFWKSNGIFNQSNCKSL